MHKRPLVSLSQTTYARTLRRDLNCLDGHVPERIYGRSYAARSALPSKITTAIGLVSIAAGMAIATLAIR